MLLNKSDILIFSRLLHPEKALNISSETELISMDFKLVQPLKTSQPMYLTDSGISTKVRFVQPEKHHPPPPPCPNAEMELGILIDDKDVHPSNILLFNTESELDNLTPVRLEHP